MKMRKCIKLPSRRLRLTALAGLNIWSRRTFAPKKRLNLREGE